MSPGQDDGYSFPHEENPSKHTEHPKTPASLLTSSREVTAGEVPQGLVSSLRAELGWFLFTVSLCVTAKMFN